MTLQLLHSEIPYIWGNFLFFFISAHILMRQEYTIRNQNRKGQHLLRCFPSQATEVHVFLDPSIRRDLTVRGQSYVWRLPKYWLPTPSPPGECVPSPLVRGEDTLAGWKGGWGGVNILEDARHSSVLYICKHFVRPSILSFLLGPWVYAHCIVCNMDCLSVKVFTVHGVPSVPLGRNKVCLV